MEIGRAGGVGAFFPQSVDYFTHSVIVVEILL